MEEKQTYSYSLGEIRDITSMHRRIGYNEGHTKGFVKGLVIGFVGGMLLIALTQTYVNYPIKQQEIPSIQQPQTHIQPFTQSELPNKFDNNKELKLK